MFVENRSSRWWGKRLHCQAFLNVLWNRAWGRMLGSSMQTSLHCVTPRVKSLNRDSHDLNALVQGLPTYSCSPIYLPSTRLQAAISTYLQLQVYKFPESQQLQRLRNLEI